MIEDFSEHYDVIGDGIAVLKPESLSRSKRFVEDMNNMSKMPVFTRTVDDELAAAKARIAELEATLAAIESADWTHMEEAQDRIAELVEALELIAESCDVGRHDGLPEEGPALCATESWLIAKDALVAYRKGSEE